MAIPGRVSTETPHDSLFRYAFGQPAVAADHFRATLAPALAAAVRWDTLELVPGTFVDENLRAIHSDVLYRAELDGGEPLWLYVLLEHQSTPDPRMPWRLLRYMVRIWDQTDADGPLPCIVPLVLYNGQRPWTVPLEFHGVVSVPEALAADVLGGVPQFRYGLMDLSRTDDAELHGMALRRLVLLLLKHAHEGDFWERLPAWLDTLEAVVREPPDGLKALEAVWRYVMNVTPRDMPDGVRTLVVARLPGEGGRMVTSWGQRLEEHGRQIGRQEGLRQGRAEALLDLLRAKFGAVPEDVDARVRAASDEELTRWLAQILTADTIEATLR